MSLLSSLNEQQLKAVTAPPCNMLVLAGAGSGKTRVLTQRIAWLIHECHYSPYSLLAVTFTNKAAAEMRGRIESLLTMDLRNLWVGTFHSTAHRLLRLHWKEAGLSQAFQIIDSDDQYRFIRRVIKALNLDENQWSPRQAQHFINNKKDDGVRAHQIDPSSDYYTMTLRRIYEAYEQLCAQSHLVDFSELLLRAYELFRDNPVILQHYRQRFRYVLIDEFQDTNVIQYAWMKLLVEFPSQIMIVGDDDQSIYGWRGARIENIRKFSQDFKDALVLRLEQNYRSTNVILKAANGLIAHNNDRMGKNLWSTSEGGSPIFLYTAFNEIDEAKFVAERITDWINKGGSRKEIAVLYRSNAQSRVIEESLIHASIPYRVYGGLRFFERAEIKDALAYLRLIVNRADDAAFERVVNHPTRGIGERTLSELRTLSRAQQISLWQAAIQMIKGPIANRTLKALQTFIDLIDLLERESVELSLDEITENVLQKTGLYEHFRQQKGEKAQSKVENLEELVTATKHFQMEEDEMNVLHAFLAHAALEAGETQGEVHEDCVQLMTLHSAKGLEFPLVFMVGMEEGLFPHQLSMDEPGRLEEERRLCYVGMTRTMQQLYLSYAEIRRLHGKDEYHTVSRFVQEIPTGCIAEVRQSTQIYKPILQTSQTHTSHESGLKLGQRVFHDKFGEGIVLSFEGIGAHARVEIKFNQFGIKWLVLAYAKLEPVAKLLNEP